MTKGVRDEGEEGENDIQEKHYLPERGEMSGTHP